QLSAELRGADARGCDPRVRRRPCGGRPDQRPVPGRDRDRLRREPPRRRLQVLESARHPDVWLRLVVLGLTPRYQHVVFDLDGTLVDSRADLVAAANHVLRTLGLPAISPPTLYSYVGDGARVLMERGL